MVRAVLRSRPRPAAEGGGLAVLPCRRGCAEAGQAYNPDSKILVTLRDPVDRAYSNHLHEIRARHVSGRNLVFENAIENNSAYLDQGFYARHLKAWLAAFPREQVLVTFQEDLKADSDAQTARLASFMGFALPSAFVQMRSNESMDYNNRMIGMTFWRLGHAARRAGLAHVVEGAKRLPVVRSLRKANQKDLRRLVAPMRNDTVARLKDAFRDDVAELAELVGRAPPWRRFAEV